MGDSTEEIPKNFRAIPHNSNLFIAAGGQFGNNVLDCAMAMVRDSIQNNAVSHNGITSVFCAWFALGHALYAARSMPLL